MRHVEDCTQEAWDDPVRGSVRWWELFGGDATDTSEITFGIAEVPADGHRLNRGHSHDAAEVYFVLSGEGEVVVGGETIGVSPGSAVWIPADVEHFARAVGAAPLRIAYVFGRDRFSDVTYSFPDAD